MLNLLSLSGKIEQEPTLRSNPNWPHFPCHVGINEQNAPNQVPATITPKYFRR